MWKPWHDEWMRRDYVGCVRPLFVRMGYAALLPDALDIDPNTKNAVANAGAVEMYANCTQSLYREGRTYRLFAITHELGHVITQAELAKVALGAVECSWKGGEYVADLLACFVISETTTSLSENVQRELDGFAIKLGEGDFSHPPGEKRVSLMKEFFSGANGLRVGAGDVRQDVLKPLLRRVYNAQS